MAPATTQSDFDEDASARSDARAGPLPVW